MATASEKIKIENVNTPRRVERVDRRKFIAMRDALLKVLPSKTPGLTSITYPVWSCSKVS